MKRCRVHLAGFFAWISVAACGGGGGVSQSDLANACVYIDACVGYNMASQCVRGYTYPDDQIRCVLDAQTDCDGVLACLGARRDPEPGCQDRCEGNVRVECRGDEAWREDCDVWALGNGPVCVEEALGSARCVAATCTDVNTMTCDGTHARWCMSDGGLIEFDCAPGLCFGDGRCSDTAPVSCTTSDTTCDGDFMVTCEDGLETRINCRDRDQSLTCRDIDLGGGSRVIGCDIEGECSTFVETVCSGGTDVTYCDEDGNLATVDCTSLGFSTCFDGVCEL